MQRKTVHRNPVIATDDDVDHVHAVSVLTVIASILFVLLVVAIAYFSQMATQ